MKTEFNSIIQLFHTAAFGTLATHSTHLPGYPFASILPFVPNESHFPVFLMSHLAEHTKNVLQNPCASFIISNPKQGHILSAARITMMGDVAPVIASPALLARYLRYQPEAEQYLSLGGFEFFQLTPQMLRHIGGFGQMGWINAQDWASSVTLSIEDETAIIHECIAAQRPGVRLLGIDCFGFDIELDGKRERQRFPNVLQSTDRIQECVQRALSAL
jgi:putative heme iron utilization protein